MAVDMTEFFTSFKPLMPASQRLLGLSLRNDRLLADVAGSHPSCRMIDLLRRR